ncbi:hypothetical protein R6G85_00150 [Actinotignum urinale]|uniref:hypothetical protein n=1 Tax=Actinotignum urinale TaxID=190146 RepID=UPI002A8339AE|nr:hypothetical protein [Actinotignum urinale]MDY5150906.1 hypothetical protein [Actinotignum urinale]
MRQISLSRGPSRVQWAIPAVSMLIGFLFFLRDPSDLQATVQHAMLLIWSICTGNFVNFYSLSADSTIMIAMYGFVFYAIIAIFLIPIAIILALFIGFDYTNATQVMLCVRYTQLVIVALLCLTAWFVGKLARKLEYDSGTAKWAAYLYLASPITLFADAVFWQYDVITLVFFITAMVFYVQHDYIKFSLIMSLAIACKMFAFFAFAPLILFVEKRVLPLMKYGALGVSVTLVTELLQQKMPGYEIAKAQRAHLFSKLIDNGIPFSFGYVSLALVALALITIYAYVSSPKSEEDFRHKAIYLAFISLALPFVLFQANTYWWILVTPFLAILIAGHPKMQELMVLATGFFVFIIAHSVIFFSIYMDQNMINGGVIPKLLGIKYSGLPSFQSIADKLGLNLPQVIYAFAIALMIGICVLCAQRMKLADAMVSGTSPLTRASAITEPSVSTGTVYLYNAGLYVYILPTFALFARQILMGQ